MKKWKRLTALVLSMALLFPALTVRAEEEYQCEPELIYPVGPEAVRERNYYAGSEDGSGDIPVEQKAGIYRELEKRITNALLSGELVVDLTGIDMDYMAFYDDYYEKSPYFGKGIRVYTYVGGDEMELINPFSREETAELLGVVNGRIAEIDSLLTEDMSDLQKTLAVHDYLVYTFEYDYDNLLSGRVPQDSYFCAGMLMNGRGVCNAYTLTYQYFMERAGIECHYTASSSMNHAWNIIKIDGQYYHVDCTWDDPVRDRLGLVSHNHFLVSDEEMRNSRKHDGWDRTDLVCNDTRYDNAYWVGVNSQIIHCGESDYYIKESKEGKEGSVCRRTNDQEEKIAGLGIWPTWQGSGWWMASFSGLFFRDGYFYYNSYDKILRMNLETGETEAVFEPDLTEGYVYGIRDRGDAIQYVIKQSYRDQGTVFTAPISLAVPVENIVLDQTDLTLSAGDQVQLSASVTPSNASANVEWNSGDPSIATVDANGLVTAVAAGSAVITARAGDASAECKVTVKAPEYVLGDVNHDGNKDIADLRLILRAVCGKIQLTDQQKLAADVEKDDANAVNISDLRKMLRFICGKIESLE